MRKTDKNTIILEVTDSSNNYAKQLIAAKKAQHGTVVLAYCQRAGKGHAGNHWESEAKKNLLMSIVLFPEFLPAEKQFYLSKIISLAIIDLLQKEIPDEAVSIKWPNDIYAGDRKLAGILIENSVSGQYMHSSVVGVGLNLNQEKFGKGIPNPVSLKQLTGNNYSIEEMAARLLNNFYSWYSHLEMQQIRYIDISYLGKLYRKNQWCRFRKNSKEFEARISGIGEYGQLILEDRNGRLSEFQFKEIEFVI
jgi:BirA family biotin operon repressor/biotin-[acetyl-CoA-carboxylase] ligase